MIVDVHVSEIFSTERSRQKSRSRDVLNFTEAVVNSGLAADVERGLAFVLGNIGVGKSSVVNTLKRFTENPKEDPIPVLSKDHHDLLETFFVKI